MTWFKRRRAQRQAEAQALKDRADLLDFLSMERWLQAAMDALPDKGLVDQWTYAKEERKAWLASSERRNLLTQRELDWLDLDAKILLLAEAWDDEHGA